jgi:hypothetical protein
MTPRKLAFASLLIPALLIPAVGMAPAALAATVTVINLDGPNEGFNDPTPATPIGGNPGTTVGQQRLIAFQFAADLWGATFDSNVEIRVDANFDPLACTATAATLGSAGTITIIRDFTPTGLFPGPVAPATWHGQALANKRAGYDLLASSDIRARFNSNLGNVGCLTGSGWYYGLDNNHGTQIDLVTVVLHELGHGFGFQQFGSLTTGAMTQNLPDVYNRQLLDLSTGKTWDQMTNAERVASAINTRRVVWTGSGVTADIPQVLSLGTPLLTVTSPASVAGDYAVGTAAFGPPLGTPGVTGELVAVDDGVPPPGDGCGPPVNAAALAGRIALIDRGTCTFTVKVKFAQDAGAIGAIIVNNVAGAPPPGLGGTDPTITIPSVMITLPDGNALKAALAGGPVVATLGVNPAVYAGATAAGQALMNAPNPVQVGSSISHWDPIMSRNQLMEPSINADLLHALTTPADLTASLMRDIGWYPDADLDGVADGDDCQAQSNLEPILTYGGCNTGVPNILFPNGCTLRDLIDKAAFGAGNHGAFVSKVAALTEVLVADGTLTEDQKDAIMSCVAQSDTGKKPRGPRATPLVADAVPFEALSVRLAGSQPSRGGAELQLAIPAAGDVGVRILDVRGAVVWKADRSMTAGRHTVRWDGADASGRPAPAGVYFVQVAVAGEAASRRFVMLR